jgi:sporulation protein YlmC with PRC-barrel domain
MIDPCMPNLGKKTRKMGGNQMKRSTLLVSVFFMLALLLAACGPEDGGDIPQEPGFDGGTGDPAPGEIPGVGTEPAPGGIPETGPEPTLPQTPEATVDPSMDETPVATATVPAPAETETVPATPAPTQPETGTGDTPVRGAQVVPDTGRSDATILSELLGYQVVDQNGSTIGSVDDFILNLCEAHIIYVVLESDSSMQLEGGNLVVFPYETVTLEDGVIDVDQRVITVNIDAEQFAAGPTVSERLDLTTTEWEADIRAHWSEVGQLSNLSTDCNVPASGGMGDSNTNDNANANDNANDNSNDNSNTNTNTNNNDNSNTTVSGRQDIVRIAYATEVLDMQLVDGNGNLIGEIEEVLVEPESGWLPYMAIRPDDNGELVLVPLGALNLDTSGDGAAQDQNLVLLVEPDIFMNAPTVDSLPVDGMQGDSFNYWSQHIPMTREELP